MSVFVNTRHMTGSHLDVFSGLFVLSCCLIQYKAEKSMNEDGDLFASLPVGLNLKDQ